MIQVVVARWHPRPPGHDACDLKAVLLTGAAPADGIAHIRVDDRGAEWRIAFFVDAPTDAAARRRVEDLLCRTSAVLPRPAEQALEVAVVTDWFRRTG